MRISWSQRFRDGRARPSGDQAGSHLVLPPEMLGQPVQEMGHLDQAGVSVRLPLTDTLCPQDRQTPGAGESRHVRFRHICVGKLVEPGDRLVKEAESPSTKEGTVQAEFGLSRFFGSGLGYGNGCCPS